MGNKPLLIAAFLMLNVFLLIQKGTALDFVVGGSKGWTVPAPDSAENIYNQWAEARRFQLGETICKLARYVFSYEANKDSVLRVSKEDYNSCNTGNPLQKYSDGHSIFQLTKTGPHYFISGVKENCQKNDKIVVVVLAERKDQSSTAASMAIYSISTFLASSSILLL